MEMSTGTGIGVSASGSMGVEHEQERGARPQDLEPVRHVEEGALLLVRWYLQVRAARHTIGAARRAPRAAHHATAPPRSAHRALRPAYRVPRTVLCAPRTARRAMHITLQGGDLQKPDEAAPAVSTRLAPTRSTASRSHKERELEEDHADDHV